MVNLQVFEVSVIVKLFKLKKKIHALKSKPIKKLLSAFEFFKFSNCVSLLYRLSLVFFRLLFELTFAIFDSVGGVQFYLCITAILKRYRTIDLSVGCS